MMMKMTPIEKNNITEAIVFYLTNNQSKLKDMCRDILEQRKQLMVEELPVLHDDVNKQCSEIILSIFNIEMSKDMGIDSESIASVIEDMDVISYLEMEL